MMRDSAFLSVDSASETAERLDAVIGSETSNFVHLAEIAGFDRSLHFRGADLKGVDFSDCDLRGFDFSGACLRGAQGNKNTIWDATTILTDADIGGSMFDVVSDASGEDGLPKGLLGQHWAEQIIWMDQIRPNPENYLEDAKKLLMVFLRSDDAFVRRTAMNLLAKHIPTEEIIAIIDNFVLGGDERGVVSAAFSLLKNLFHQRPEIVTKLAVKHLKGNWTAEAAVFLAYILPMGSQLLHLSELVSRFDSVVIRRRYLTALAERDGIRAATAIRDPLSGDVYDFGESVRLESIEATTRFIIRRKRVVSDAMLRGEAVGGTSVEYRRDLALLNEFPERSHIGVREHVIEVIERFNRYGAGYRLPIVARLNSDYRHG